MSRNRLSEMQDQPRGPLRATAVGSGRGSSGVPTVWLCTPSPSFICACGCRLHQKDTLLIIKCLESPPTTSELKM